jgi:uncharacterized protein YdaU (DUF1376 family)
MSTDKLPYMPMWIADYLADTTHLDCRQHGAYFLLLCAYWQKQGPLPDNDRHLAAITKSTPHAWRAMRETMAEFFAIKDGHWVHKRVEAELAKALDTVALAKNRGARGAETRWKNREAKNIVHAEKSQKAAKEKSTNGSSSMSQASPEQCLRHAISESESSKTLAIASAGPEPGDGPPIVDDGPWDRGVEILARSGVPSRRGRECLGRWIQAHGRDAVTRALDRAAAEQPAEPIAFLERVLTAHGQNQNRNARHPARLGLGDALDAALAQLRAAEPGQGQIRA